MKIANSRDLSDFKSKELIELECEFCRGIYRREYAQVKSALLNKRKIKFCSTECHISSRTIGEDKKCLNCDKEIFVKQHRSSSHKFCCRKCATDWNKSREDELLDGDKKQCSICKNIKSLDEFYLREDNNRYRKRCKKCIKNGLKSNPKTRYNDYKRAAKDREYEFEISEEYFATMTTSKECFYCGCSPTKYEPLGIDRADNIKGYTVENCLPCCWICNKMKNTLSEEQFLKAVENIYKHKIK